MRVSVPTLWQWHSRARSATQIQKPANNAYSIELHRFLYSAGSITLQIQPPQLDSEFGWNYPVVDKNNSVCGGHIPQVDDLKISTIIKCQQVNEFINIRVFNLLFMEFSLAEGTHHIRP